MYESDFETKTQGSGTITSSSHSDSSHLFQPVQSTVKVPGDIAHCRDNQPVQPRCRSFPKTKIGDRNRSFAVHWYQSYSFIEYSLQ